MVLIQGSWDHFLLPRVSFCQEIRIFILPKFCFDHFIKIVREVHGKCLEWFGHSTIRTVIVEGPYDQELIFVRQTFRDPFDIGYRIFYSCQNYPKKNDVCQRLTFRDVIFSKFHNIVHSEEIIGRSMGYEERKAYMLQQQIIPIRDSLDVHATRFDHDLLDLIERHCPEVDEEQMAEIMQWKAANATREDQWSLWYTLWEFVVHDDRPCNALHSQAWNEIHKESRVNWPAASMSAR